MIQILVLGTFREWGGYLNKLKRENPNDWEYYQQSRKFETSHSIYYFIPISYDVMEKMQGTEFHDIIYLDSCANGLTMREYQYSLTRKRLQYEPT